MLRQFKGVKWLNKVPYFILYDYSNNNIELVKVKDNIFIKKTDIKKCNGYYDLTTHKYIVCPNFSKEISNNVKQCDTCSKITGFNDCLGCNGRVCRNTNKIARDFCNQKHVVYIALFGNDKMKVGTAAEYRKYSRILEQGAIASMFIAETSNGKQARFIEHTISKLGYVLQVNSLFKIKNIIIDKERDEINSILKNEYKKILSLISDSFKDFFINPELNYCEKINKINKKIFLKNETQLSLFDDNHSNVYDVNYMLHYDNICGKIVNVLGTFIVIKTEQDFFVYDTKELEGFIVDIKFS